MDEPAAFPTSGLAALHSVGLAVVKFRQRRYDVPNAASTLQLQNSMPSIPTPQNTLLPNLPHQNLTPHNQLLQNHGTSYNQIQNNQPL